MKTSTSAPSPLSPKLWPTEAFTWWKSLLFALAIAVLPFIPALIFIAFLLVFRAATVPQLSTLSWPTITAQFVFYAIQLPLFTVVLPKIARRPLAALGLRAPRLSDLVWGIGGAIAMIALATLAAAVQVALFHLKADEVQVQQLRLAHGSLVIGIALLACAAAPFFEELTFRGFLFNALLRYMPAWLAILISGAIFGSVHYQPGNAGALLPLAVGGLVLATVYYRSGSLIASMLTHSLFNTFTVVLVLGFHQN